MAIRETIAESDPYLNELLEFVRAETGLDFRQYRRATIERRLGLRMMVVGTPSCQDYLAFLRNNEPELPRLLHNLTLKVSSFFREPRALDLVKASLLKEMVAHRRLPSAPSLRIWSAGCAHGEEPYSVAILLLEALADFEQSFDFEICATDVDRPALQQAEAARYRVDALAHLPPLLVDKYFHDDEPGRAPLKVLDSTVRRHVNFLYHDLVTAEQPPLDEVARFDLILCRNVFIYFQRPLQERVLRLLYSALDDHGILVLGESESISVAMADCFDSVDRKAGVYRKKDVS